MFRKAVLVASAVLCLAAAPAAALASAANDLRALLNAHERAERELYPSAAIQRGEDPDLDRFEDDLTTRHLLQRQRLNAQERQRLYQIERNALTPEEQLSYDVFAWMLEDERRELAPNVSRAFQMLPLNQFGGAHLEFAREMQWRSDYPFTAARDYIRTAERMAGFARWIDNAIARMRDGMRVGITQPRVLVERMIPQLDALANADPATSIFFGPVRSMPANISGAERERASRVYTDAVRTHVLPAYARLRDFLKTEYLPAARQSVGLAAMPTGRELYLTLVRHHTTEELSPQEIHALGLAEVARIRREMEAVKAEAGFTGTLDAFQTSLRSDPRFVFADSESLLDAFRRVDAQVAGGLTRLFRRVPDARLEFRLIESYAAPSRAAAEYTAPSNAGRRPGIVYVNAFDLPSRPRYAIEALALHEGRPGHHLQTAMAIENARLPRFRRYATATAFVEGWALYAESLGSELGLYRDPYSKFGALSFDAWRASRLVVDTGIHWLGWTREDGIAYLLANTALSETDATAEVERYIALPAQALAYKIGQRKFVSLRERAQAALGTKFDIRDFHDALLRDGAMPLPILDAKMTRWLAAEGR